MKEGVIIRRMIKADIEHISQAFIHQGWPGREDILTSYFQEQENRERDVLVAESDGFVAGYITILPVAKHGPFVGVYPELTDFNVFEPFRSRGIGNQLLEEAEKRVQLLSEIVTLGVGLHSGYGPAQRLYVKRGYIPDGSGVWFRDQPLAPYSSCENNDDLVLYFSKRLNREIQ